jgi:hypothetical protein
MSAADNLILAAIFTAAVTVIMWIIRRKKQNRNGCEYCRNRESCGSKPAL